MLGWLFGIKDLSGGSISDLRISFTRITASWHWFAVLGLMAGLAALVAWLYYREPSFVRNRKKVLLGVLRVLGLWLVVFILLGPVVRLEKTGTTKTNVVVLVDSSQSMSIRDRRTQAEDLLRAGKALGAVGEDQTGLDPAAAEEAGKARRIELVEGVLNDQQLDFLGKLDDEFRLHTFLFSSGLEPFNWADPERGPFATDGVATELGSSLRAVMEEFRGQPLGGIVVFTDGGMNRGEDPAITAQFAQDIGNPCYTVGVGLHEARDVQVNYIFSDDIVFIEDQVPVYVRMRAAGYSGETATLKVMLDEKEVASREITLQEGEKTELIHFTPEKAGEFDLTVKSDPRPDELLTTNNARSKKVRVIDKKIAVLIIEGDPRWEFRYVKNTLARDKRVDLKIFLTGADRDYAEHNDKYLKNLPREKKDLFKYDVIIFGNADKDQISSQTLEYLKEFVGSMGGGLLVIADRKHMPWQYSETPLAEMLPVVFEARAGDDARNEIYSPLQKSFGLRLTDEGMSHTVTRFEQDRDENERLWRKASPHYWYAPVSRAKPHASVLVAHASQRNTYGDVPVVALGRYGKGWVMWNGVDTFWRWRFEPGPKYFDRFWGQAIQNLSMVHILGESRRIQLGTDNREYAVGDKVEVSARVLDQSFAPLIAEQLAAVVVSPARDSREFILSGDAARRGVFSGSFLPDRVGEYEIRLKHEDQEARVSFKVEAPQIEFNNPAMRIELLQNIAATTGGKFYRIDEVAGIHEEIQKVQGRVTERVEDDLWDAPLTMILFVLLLGTEVFLRKRSDLA